MLTEIIELRNEGKSFQKISDQLGVSIGKVRYQWKKFQTSKQKERSFTPVIQCEEIPERMNQVNHENNLSIILTSPDRLFCQWSIQDWLIAAMNKADAPFINLEVIDLRLYDVTDILFNGENAHHVYHFKLPRQMNRWSIKGLKRNRSYLCELGFITAQQSFFPLLCSHPVHTPYDHPSQQISDLPFIQRDPGSSRQPPWIEHISTYTYYERYLEEDHD
ncbi:DUF4912 domain-containing protein [Bacillus ectoiniformans]|uniref:DUF4912 domain-containing protein n=1 Tax=Bacillus ectoiniformans TaxID=1494429 RepID=UPI0019580FFA|nr:DUF4912 domain-containing protein [Bacillus ectoiniformans]